MGHSQNAGCKFSYWKCELGLTLRLAALPFNRVVKFFNVIFNMSLFRSSRFGSN